MTSINDQGVYHRLPSHLPQDAQESTRNILSDVHKEWPNEAGFDNLDEHRGPIPLIVKGSIPDFAAGALYRTGPGQSKLDMPNGKTHYVSHWFDGFAHTHRFDIVPDTERPGNTTVEYSSRRNSEAYVKTVKEKGWRSAITVGQRSDPCVGIFAKTMSVFQPIPRRGLDYNVVVNANFPALSRLKGDKPLQLGHKGTPGPRNIFITSDMSNIQELHPDTLEHVGYTGQSRLRADLGGELSGAHAQIDPKTGDRINFNLKVGPGATYRVFSVSAATGETEILATIPAGLEAPPAYIHSMFLTENYAILALPSSRLGWNGLKIVWQRTIIDSFLPFSEDLETLWFVVDRFHGRGVVARFTTPAGFFFHSINAFEEKEHVTEDGEERVAIIADLSAYETTDIVSSFYYDIILDREDAFQKFWSDERRRKGSVPNIKRFNFSLPSISSTAAHNAGLSKPFVPGSILLNIPNPHGGELPTMNPLYACKPYRYVYSLSLRGLSTLLDCIVKTDLETGEVVFWSGPKGSQPGEAIFVPRPEGKTEDDGVLLSVVLDGVKGTSYLLCLDARTMEEMGRAEADFAVAIGFHGIHVPPQE
ncbi:retinal pigment epithelial membrane protein [Sarocladium implicatum]|nr:retinal pigment epithelial membrane protein [Sarocladium implicatum]